MKNSHTAISTRKGLNCGVWVGLGWVVVNEKQGKQESLSHYRIIMDMQIVVNQKALQEQPLSTQQCRFSGEAILATSNTQLCQMKSMNNTQKFLSSHSYFSSAYFYRWKLWRNIMAKAWPGQVQIRHTLLDAEGLSSRVAVNKESIQYIFMTRVISSMKKLSRTQTNGIKLFLWTHDVTAIM